MMLIIKAARKTIRTPRKCWKSGTRCGALVDLDARLGFVLERAGGGLGCSKSCLG